jgi:dipeptidyl aminopeptidase/acylaminoacyl peptidase
MRSNRQPAWDLIGVTACVLAAIAGCAQQQSGGTVRHAGKSGGSGQIAGNADLRERGPGIEKFYKMRVPSSVRLAPDGAMYVRDWPDGVNQLYRVPAAGNQAPLAVPDKPMTRLTDFKDGCTGYSMSRDGSRMLVMTAMGGNEKTQVYLLDRKNDDPKTNLTPVLVNPEVVFRPNAWSFDSSAMFFTANLDDINNFHVYRYDFQPGAKDKDGNPVAGTYKRLLAKEGDWSVADVSRDTKSLLVTQYRSSSDSDVHILEAQTGKLTLLNPAFKLPAGQTASLDPVGFSTDEKSVYITSDHEGGLRKLFQVDLATLTVSKPLPGLDRFELDSVSINDARTLLAAAVNEEGFGVPYLYRLPGLEPVELPAMERGVAGLNELDDSRISYSVSNANDIGVVYSWDVPAPGGPISTPRPLTAADTQGVDLSKFPSPQLVKFSSFDGMEIPAFVYVPAGYVKGSKIPFVIDYHGGPEGQHRPIFNRFVQYLVSEGFGVMQPNVRGSSGYGRSFIMADDYKNRWHSVKDGWHAARWLVDNGYAAPGRIASYGGSYGGYMTTAVNVEDQRLVDSGSSKQRLFGACIDVVGVINLKTFLERTSGYRRKLREVEYGPLTDPEFLDSVSPLQMADKINVPVLIAHGANDPRVPVTEAMQLAEALQRRGFDPEQIYFDDEGHGFAKLDNRLLFAQRASRFLKKHIGE